MSDIKYSPTMLGINYVTIRNKYFAKYDSFHYKIDNFISLGIFLEKEKIDPISYFEFVFGILDYKHPPKPKTLMHPELIQRYRSTIR